VNANTSTEIAKGTNGAELFGWVCGLEPLMLETLSSRRTSTFVKGKHLRDEILGERSDLVPHLVAEAELAGENLIEELILGLSVERKITTEKHVKDDTDGPDIANVVVDTLLENFWSYVRRATAASSHGTGHSEILGQTEISNLHLKTINAVEKKILRLQVTVSNTVGVKIGCGRKNLLNDLASIILSERATLYNLIVQLTTTDILENKRDGLLLIENIVKLNNVRMVKFPHDGDLTLEKDDLLIILLVLIYYLHSDLLATLLACGLVHNAETTTADLLAHSVLGLKAVLALIRSTNHMSHDMQLTTCLLSADKRNPSLSNRTRNSIKSNLEGAKAVIHNVSLAHELEFDDTISHLADLLWVQSEHKFLLPLGLTAIYHLCLKSLLCADAFSLNIKLNVLLLKL